jgi:hypothetical protein
MFDGQDTPLPLGGPFPQQIPPKHCIALGDREQAGISKLPNNSLLEAMLWSGFLWEGGDNES